MQSFIAALISYFACDGAATERMLSLEEALSCARAYEAVKVSFLSDEERRVLTEDPAARAAAMLTGYRRFQDWKMQNPERVTRLREAGIDQGGMVF